MFAPLFAGGEIVVAWNDAHEAIVRASAVIFCKRPAVICFRGGRPRSQKRDLAHPALTKPDPCRKAHRPPLRVAVVL